MKALLLYPKFPPTFWSFEGIISLVGRKALLPPLGLITVASLLPQEWNFKLVDRNVTEWTDEHWDWADIVLLSGMIVQREDFLELIRTAGRRGKAVAVGGPYVTSVPDEAEEAGADYLVLDEGEITIPPFLEELARNGITRRASNQAAIVFRSDGVKPEVTSTPIPRFDLLDLDSYDGMAVQYSRGCPFLCEFCDIITLYGRRPRTKSPEQLIGELEHLLRLGRRGSIFLVDDNFIGNKKNVKKLLFRLRDWQRANNFPFSFDTEASVDLANDPQLLRLMVDCRFSAVFVGIETPDPESLALTRKHQNNRHPLIESVATITGAGMRVMCGMIIGFDNEAPGAGRRIVEFVRAAGIPTVLFSMLQALPNTALWTRLEKEGRLLHGKADMSSTTVLNFVPTRPVRQIVEEYVQAYSEIYSPNAYLERVYAHFMVLGTNVPPEVPTSGDEESSTAVACVSETGDRSAKPLKRFRQSLAQNWMVLRGVAIILTRQGLLRESRRLFWKYLYSMARNRPSMVGHYLVVCAHYEHFVMYRDRIRAELLPLLAMAPAESAAETASGKALVDSAA